MNYIINYPVYNWDLNKLIEQVYLDSIKTKEKDGITKKYEKRLRWLLRRFGIYEPPPEVIIYRNDLSKEVRGKLVQLKNISPKTLDYVIISVLEMIVDGIDETYEQIYNSDHYYLFVKRHKIFRWRFDTKEDQENDPDYEYEVNYPPYNNTGKVVGRILNGKKRMTMVLQK